MMMEKGVNLISPRHAVASGVSAAGVTQDGAARWLSPGKVQASEKEFPYSAGGAEGIFTGPESLVLLFIGTVLIVFGSWRRRKALQMEAQGAPGPLRWKR
jgi:hypothetical protein